MKRKHFQMVLLQLLLYAVYPVVILAQDMGTVWLPPPQTDGGRPLMQVLMDRQSSRSFRNDTIPIQVMSDMLWAAYGINRPESGKRTAPSAMNRQEMDIYVSCSSGLYLYDAKTHALIQVLQEDVRAMTGTQGYVKDAPVNLIYVADLSKMGDGEEASKISTASISTGCICQNVYLFCASEGLVTVVRGSIDRSVLGQLMKLRSDQRIILAQTVGYPGE